MRRRDREINDLSEIEKIIQTADCCRIALFDNEFPYIVTMNFGYENSGSGIIYFHCANKGKKIELIRSNPNVCFELDTDHNLISSDIACDNGMTYKSIVGYGVMKIVTDDEERRTGLNSIMKHYTGRNNFNFDPNTLSVTTVLRLDIKEMTGKCKKIFL